MFAISSFKFVVAIAAVLLLVTPDFSFAQGCPPWMKCGKKGNLIIPDSGGYDASVASTTSSSPYKSSYDVTQPLDVTQRSLDLEKELKKAETEAKAKAERVELKTVEDARRIGNSIWVLDRTGTGQ